MLEAYGIPKLMTKYMLNEDAIRQLITDVQQQFDNVIMVIMKTEHSPQFSLFRVANTNELNISTSFLKMVVAQSCEMLLYIYHTRLFSPW
jgi:hypothetical protein